MMKVLIGFLLFTSTLCWAKRIVVYETDSGVDISHLEIRKHINIANWEKEDYIDTNFHGTHIAGLILDGVCEEVELISCKYMDKKVNALDKSIECFKKALNLHVDIINYSSGGLEYSKEEYMVLKQLSDKGIKIIVAAGNNGQDLMLYDYYPAKYKLTNVIVVGNLDGNKRNQSSNYNLPGMVWEKGTNIWSTWPANSYSSMTGSSQAAAIHTNKLLKEMCLHVN